MPNNRIIKTKPFWQSDDPLQKPIWLSLRMFELEGSRFEYEVVSEKRYKNSPFRKVDRIFIKTDNLPEAEKMFDFVDWANVANNKDRMREGRIR